MASSYSRRNFPSLAPVHSAFRKSVKPLSDSLVQFPTVWLGVAILMMLFLERLWWIGIMHTDDAMWALWAHSQGLKPVWDFAQNQGRLWPIVSAPFVLGTLGLEGSAWFPWVKYGSMMVFMILFYGAIALYFGQRLAFTAICLFFAFFALRWEGSLTTTYPLSTWVFSALFVGAILCGYAYSRTGRRLYLGICLLLLALSLFQNEGMTALFAVVFLLSVWGNWRLTEKRLTSDEVAHGERG